MNAIILKMRQEGLLTEKTARDVDGLLAYGKTLDEALLSAVGLAE